MDGEKLSALRLLRAKAEPKRPRGRRRLWRGRAADRNLSFPFFHVSSSNGLRATNIWIPNLNFPPPGSQPGSPLLCQVLVSSQPKPE